MLKQVFGAFSAGFAGFGNLFGSRGLSNAVPGTDGSRGEEIGPGGRLIRPTTAILPAASGDISINEMIKRSEGLFGAPPVRPNLIRDEIVHDIIMLPYRGPLDQGNYAREDMAERLHYRWQYRRSPYIRAAIKGATDAVKGLTVTVLPGKNTNNPPLANRVAEFLDETVKAADGGWTKVLGDVYSAAPVDGYTLCVFKLREWAWRGCKVWGFAHTRQLDTVYTRLQLDVYRNPVSIVNMVRGLEYYSPEQVILYSHNMQYCDPFGQPDLDCVTSAGDMIDAAYQAWQLAVEVFGLPYMVGTAGTAAQKLALGQALEALRAGGYAVIQDKDKIEVLNLASAAGGNGGLFENLVNTRREDIFVGVRGSHLPFMEGKGGQDSHGDSEVQREASNIPDAVAAQAIANVIRHQLVPSVVGPTFGRDAPMPDIMIGGSNWKKVKEVVSVVKELKECGIEPSKTYVVQATGIPEARDDQDRLGAPDAAELEGKLAGLNAIMQYQQAVAGGQVQRQDAIEVLVRLFGFDAAEVAKWFSQPQPQPAMPGAAGAMPGQPQPQAQPAQGASASPGIAEMVRQALQSQPSSPQKAFSAAFEDDSSFGGGMMARGRRLLEEVAA
jgi:hypothetical protein